jgi:hypothetical protein
MPLYVCVCVCVVKQKWYVGHILSALVTLRRTRVVNKYRKACVCGQDVIQTKTSMQGTHLHVRKHTDVIANMLTAAVTVRKQDTACMLTTVTDFVPEEMM